MSGTLPPSERLMTSAPWSVAQSMPGRDLSASPSPLSSSTRTGRTLAPGRDRLDPDAVAGQRVDDAGDVGAVAVAVLRRVVVVDEVVPGQQLAGEVRVVGLDAGVDHGDDGAGAGAHRMGGVRVDHVQPPLVRPQGVRSRRPRAPHKQHADGQRGRDPCPESHGARLKAGAWPMRCT